MRSPVQSTWPHVRRAARLRQRLRFWLSHGAGIILALLVAGSACALQPQPPTLTVPVHPTPTFAWSLDPASHLRQETRALWTWVGTTARSRADIDELVSRVDAAHLNVLLFGVYLDGAPYFEPSHRRFPDPATRLTNQTRFKDDEYPDALSYVLALRDERRADDDPYNDFEIHAWFTVNKGGEATSDWPPKSQLEPYMLNALFPEFMVKSGRYYTRDDPRFVNPEASAVEQPRFRRYMIDLIAGVAEDYAIDGVHLDYIRTGGLCFNSEVLTYDEPEDDFPGCPADYAAFTEATYGEAYSLWDDTDGDRAIRDGGSGRVAAWQVHNVSLLVEGIHAAVKAVRPEVLITVASVRNVPWEPPVQGQTAWAWLDQGWIDAIFPTLYLAESEPIIERMEILRETVQDDTKRDLIFAGLATHNFDDPLGEDWTDRVLERVSALLRGQAAFDPLNPMGRGVALFRDKYLSQATIEALANGPFRERAVPYWGVNAPLTQAERPPAPP